MQHWTSAVSAVLARCKAHLGLMWEKRQNWSAAASAYEAALARNDSKAPWHFRLGRMREKMQDWPAAASAYEAALARNDSKASWHFRLGRMRGKMQDWPAAASAYEAALARNDSKAPWHFRLGLARERAKSVVTARLDESGTAGLSAIELQLGLRRADFRGTFVRLQKWLIADQSLGLFERIPHVDISPPRLVEALRKGVTSRLPLSCCAVYEGGGGATLRSFYPSRGVTIKILNSASARAQAGTDVEARSLIAKFGTLHVPQILAFNIEKDPPFIMEELIMGRHPTPHEREDKIRALIPEIWTTYRAFGFSLTEHLPDFTLEAIIDELRGVPIPPHMKCERDCRDELVSRLQELPNPVERPLLAGFGHGDLSLRNIVASNSGKLFIVDWECSCLMAVAWDLRKLIVSVPNLLPQITNLISKELQRPGWGDAMAAEHQCLVALAGRIAWHSRQGRQDKTIKSFRPVREWLPVLA
jgi:choline/ethanolamine kinase/tetratricopeptide repeat protein